MRDKVKESIQKIDGLEELEAVGIFGSLASGRLSKRSDIDIFIVVKEKYPGVDTFWYKRIEKVLEWTDRGITVIVYSLKGLKKISNWYVIRLAKEGLLIYDKGEIKRLFDKILKKVEDVGIVEEVLDGIPYFRFKEIDFERPIIFSLEDE